MKTSILYSQALRIKKIHSKIYLIECTLCNKQYVGKAQTAFNIRLNNHRKDTKNPNKILACRHSQQQGHSFNNSHAKFIIIDKLVNTSSSKDILWKWLMQQENFWIQKLKTFGRSLLIPCSLSDACILLFITNLSMCKLIID